MNATCVAFVDYDPDAPCGEPSIGVQESACIHEHVTSNPVCAADAVDVQMHAGLLTCTPCRTGPSGHRCLPLVRIVWHDGTPPTLVQKAGLS